MTGETDQHISLKWIFDSRLIKLTGIIFLFLIVLIGTSYFTLTGQSTTVNIVTSIIASAAALVAISPPTTDRQINTIENRLYNFYYPLEDYIEGYSMFGITQDTKDIERIWHYRRLAKTETRVMFESYRSGNCKQEEGVNLLQYVKCDIEYYEKRLEKLNK